MNELKTNLDVIKYFANNKPELLAELLDDIYCCGWNNGAYVQITNDYSSRERGFNYKWLMGPIDYKWVRESNVSDINK